MVSISCVSACAFGEEDLDGFESVVAIEEEQPSGKATASVETPAIQENASSIESNSSTSSDQEGGEAESFANEQNTADAVHAGTQSTFSGEGLEEAAAQQAQKFEIWYVYFDGVQDHSFVEYTLSSDVVSKPELIPERDGYTFCFWYVVGSKVERFEFGNAPEGSIVLCAYFKANEVVADVVDAQEDEDDDEEGEDQEAGDENDETFVPGIHVNISSNASSNLKFGDSVTLFAKVEGAEGLDCTATWMFNDGSGWQVAQENAGMCYCFELNECNNGWQWKMTVSVIVPEAGAAM